MCGTRLTMEKIYTISLPKLGAIDEVIKLKTV